MLYLVVFCHSACTLVRESLGSWPITQVPCFEFKLNQTNKSTHNGKESGTNLREMLKQSPNECILVLVQRSNNKSAACRLLEGILSRPNAKSLLKQVFHSKKSACQKRKRWPAFNNSPTVCLFELQLVSHPSICQFLAC